MSLDHLQEPPSADRITNGVHAPPDGAADAGHAACNELVPVPAGRPEAGRRDPIPAQDPPEPASHRDIYGLIDVGGRRLAILALNIREAVPFPNSLSAIAASLPGLLGAMVLRQDTIPLIDMAVLLDIQSEVPMDKRVVIIVIDSDHRRLVGLVVDSLQGMTALEPQQIARMGVVGQSNLLAGGESFVNDGIVVGLFDPQILFDRPNLPYALQRNRKTGRGATAHSGQQAYLLCSYNDHGIAFPVRNIQATIPMNTIRDSPMRHGPCDGIIEHHDMEIPILDSLRILGLGRNNSRPERSSSVAMRVPTGGFICFEIDRFFDIVPAGEASLQKMPEVISSRSDLFLGILIRDDGSHFLVLDDEKLLGEEAVVQLASTTIKDLDTAEEEDARAAALGRSALYLLSTSAQRVMACTLTDIVEILRLPKSLLAAKVRHDGFMGTLSHRGHLIPVFAIASLLGECATFEDEKACVMLFRVDGQLFGAVVEELVEVARCTPIGAPQDKMLQKAGSGEFVPYFEMTRELPVSATGTNGAA